MDNSGVQNKVGQWIEAHAVAFPGNVHFARVPEFPTERERERERGIVVDANKIL